MLVVTDERCLQHDTGVRHPERPERLTAALQGVAAIDAELITGGIPPRMASRGELELVHDPAVIDRVATVAAAGGGHLDADTAMGAASFEAALLAAGAVLSAVEQIDTGLTGLDSQTASSQVGSGYSEGLVGGSRVGSGCSEGLVGDPQVGSGSGPGPTRAYCLVRPPGHHATAEASMGFCLFNSVAVAAAWLAAAGQRVAVVDIDAHHGNGTQDIFWNRADVLYASIHQHPLYPGTGALSDTGTGPGRGMTVNVPVPTGATGDVARAALDDVIIPAVDRFSPDWMLISAGYDGHQADPLTGLCYSASDYGALVRRLVSLAPRTVAVLEGGYDLEATAASSYAVAGALLDLDLSPDSATEGGPGMQAVARATVVNTHER